MNTKVALKILSKGGKVHAGIQSEALAERADYYKDQYDARQAQILDKKNQETFQLPFAIALQNKLAKINKRSEPDVPVATVFEVFQGIKRLAAQDEKDRGLRWLSQRLARHWAAEPDAAITSRQVISIRNHIAANFGRSKAGKLLEQEVARIGFHKLPVAKLARIAAQIGDQADYDEQIVLAGLTSNSAAHIRSRTMLRALAGLRNAKIAGEAEVDERTATERALDAVEKAAQIENQPTIVELAYGPGDWGHQSIAIVLSDGSKAYVWGETDDAFIVSPTGAVRKRVVNYSDPTLEPYLNDEDVAAPQRTMTQDEQTAFLQFFPDATESFMKGVPKQAQMDQMMKPPAPPSQEETLEEGGPVDEGPDLDGPPQPEAPGEADPELGDAVDIIKQVEDFVEEEAPPEAEPYIEHEMNEGHEFPAGSAGWGFEEAEEGHTAPPPSEEWQQEEIQELETGASPDGGMGAPPEMEAPPMEDAPHGEMPLGGPMGASKRAKGLDEPMPDGAEGPPQREVETYMPEPSSDGGTELKSASQIEEDLLAGLTVTANGCSIRISDNDEVELYVRGAGKACDMLYMDAAIDDFRKYAKSDKTTPKKFEGAFHIAQLLPVPCERCASITYFPDLEGTDAFACDCGNKVASAGVYMLVKTGQLEPEYRIEIALPVEANKQAAEARKRQIIRTVESAMPHASVSDEGGGMLAFSVRQTDENDIRKVEHKLKAMGVQQFDAQRWAQMLQPQTVVHAPGSGAAEEVEPQGVAAPQPAQPGPEMAAPEEEEGITYDDMAAAIRHYKSIGKNVLDATREFYKDYRDRIGEGHWGTHQDAELTDILEQYYHGAGADAETAKPMVSASKKNADAMKPKVNQQQPDAEHIKKTELGTEGSDDRDPGTMGAPKKPKGNHPMKGTGPLSNKDMNHGGPGTDEQDVNFKAPKPKANGQVPGAGDAAGTHKVTDTNLGKDSDTYGKGIPTPGTISPGRSDRVIKPKKAQRTQAPVTVTQIKSHPEDEFAQILIFSDGAVAYGSEKETIVIKNGVEISEAYKSLPTDVYGKAMEEAQAGMSPPPAEGLMDEQDTMQWLEAMGEGAAIYQNDGWWRLENGQLIQDQEE